MPEGRQSPEPERQSGKQQQSPPGSGQGTDNADNKEQVNADQLQNLSSNPKVKFIDWIQTAANTPVSTTKRRPDGTFPGRTEIATNPAYFEPAQYSNATAVAEAQQALDDFKGLTSERIKFYATNIFQAHKQAYLQQKQPDEVFVAQVKDKKFGILGAGITGLFTALILDSVGIHNWKILESSHRIGGCMLTSYLNGTSPDDGQYHELDLDHPSRCSHVIKQRFFV
ncbi:hypothetical protein BN1723_010760 [Verticillium longisporum]|uniref:Amine oxidase domain-containing protein n=1 Tax=Verticillium longisporum TaxID=100787 RepID=A0A0G4L1V4_VERLO|nr:hypothetical protein BN1723_010760 [Verticillium longisporum]